MLAYTFYEVDNRVMEYAEALASRGTEGEVIALRHPPQTRAGHARKAGELVRKQYDWERKMHDYFSLVDRLALAVEDGTELSVAANVEFQEIGRR